MVGALAVALSAAALTTAAAASAEPVAPDGTITTWGRNDFDVNTVPASLTGKTVTAVAAGGNHSLALTSDGVVTGWGYNAGGQATAPSSLDDRRVTAIAAGWHFSMALTADGKVTTWGYAPAGPPAGLDDERVTAIAGGFRHALALTAAGKVVAWGDDEAGQTDVPASLEGKKVVAISANFAWSMALTEDGMVTTWGSGDLDPFPGQPDAKVTPPIPDELTGERVVAISAGYQHLTAATADGDVVTWGRYDPRPELAQEPAALAGKTITSLAAASDATYALTSDGKAYGWGAPYWDSVLPATLSTKRVTALSVTVDHAMALTGRPSLAAASGPSITGIARAGQTLTATAPTYDATPDAVTFQWFADGEPISGATASTLELTTAHVGASITVATTATKADHVDAVNTSAPVGPVAQAPVVTPNPPTPAPVPAPSTPKTPGATSGTVYSKAPTSGVVLAGRGTPGATITVREGSTVVGTAKVDPEGTWTLTVTSLRPGRHAFSATQTVDGRTSVASAADAVTIARLKVSIVKAVSPTAAKRPVVRGRGNPGAQIVVRTTAGRKLGTTTVKTDGRWSLRTTKLKRGTYKVRATQTIAGQTIRSTTIKFRTTARN